MKVFLFLLPADGGGAERKLSHAASLLKLRRCWDHSLSHSGSQSVIRRKHLKEEEERKVQPSKKTDWVEDGEKEREREKKASQLNAFLCD